MKNIVSAIAMAFMLCFIAWWIVCPDDKVQGYTCSLAPADVVALMQYHGPLHDYTLYPDGRLVLHRDGEDIEVKK